MKKPLFISISVVLLFVVVIVLRIQLTDSLQAACQPVVYTTASQAAAYVTVDNIPVMTDGNWELTKTRMCPVWDEDYTDPMVSPAWEKVPSLSYHLSDTIPERRLGYYFYRDKWAETSSSNGGASVAFQVKHSSGTSGSHAILPIVIRRPLSDGMCFESDWEIEVPKMQHDPLGCFVDNWNAIRVQQDTIVTHTQGGSTGITPEGQVFRLTGNDVERIEARTRCAYLVAEGIMMGVQESWGVPVGYLVSPWVDCTLRHNSYQLPVADKIMVNSDIFGRIKKAAVAIQRRYLVDRRDSLIASAVANGDGEWVPQVLDEWKARLNPDFEAATTLKELSICFELDHFETELTVHLRNGKVCRYTHWADYEVDIP